MQCGCVYFLPKISSRQFCVHFKVFIPIISSRWFCISSSVVHLPEDYNFLLLHEFRAPSINHQDNLGNLKPNSMKKAEWMFHRTSTICHFGSNSLAHKRLSPPPLVPSVGNESNWESSSNSSLRHLSIFGDLSLQKNVKTACVLSLIKKDSL